MSNAATKTELARPWREESHSRRAWRRFRRNRAALAGLVTAGALTLLSSGAAGFKNSLGYMTLLRQMSYGSSTWSQVGQQFHIDPANQAPSALITRLLTVSPDGSLTGVASMPTLAKGLSSLAALALLGIGMFFTWGRNNNEETSSKDLTGFGLITLLSLLIPSLMWDHYLVIALLPAVIYLSRMMEDGTQSSEIALTAAALFVINIPFDFWNPVYSHGWTILLSSIKLYGTLILLVLLCKQLNTGAGHSEETGALP